MFVLSNLRGSSESSLFAVNSRSKNGRTVLPSLLAFPECGNSKRPFADPANVLWSQLSALPTFFQGVSFSPFSLLLWPFDRALPKLVNHILFPCSPHLLRSLALSTPAVPIRLFCLFLLRPLRAKARRSRPRREKKGTKTYCSDARVKFFLLRWEIERLLFLAVGKRRKVCLVCGFNVQGRTRESKKRLGNFM